MPSRELTLGRTFGVTFEHGDSFFAALAAVSRKHDIACGYIPMFVAGFSVVDVVGTCEHVEDPQAPLWKATRLHNVEAVGAGTLALTEDGERFAPHIHVAVGLKHLSATGYTSHLLDAIVAFTTELILVEVLDPPMRRIPDPYRYNVPLLHFGDAQA